MRSCRALYHAVAQSDALARAKILHMTLGAHEDEMQRRSGGHWKAALRRFERERKELRLVVGWSAALERRLHIVLDVNCVLWRRMYICLFPDLSK